MSRPPLRAYGCIWLLLGLVFGGAAWLLWKRPWVAVGAGLGLGFVGLVVLIACSEPPRSPGLAPDDPRR